MNDSQKSLYGKLQKIKKITILVTKYNLLSWCKIILGGTNAMSHKCFYCNSPDFFCRYFLQGCTYANVCLFEEWIYSIIVVLKSGIVFPELFLKGVQLETLRRVNHRPSISSCKVKLFMSCVCKRLGTADSTVMCSYSMSGLHSAMNNGFCTQLQYIFESGGNKKTSLCDRVVNFSKTFITENKSVGNARSVHAALVVQ